MARRISSGGDVSSRAKPIQTLAIVGVQGVPASYGGFETTAAALSSILKSRYDVAVICSSKDQARVRVPGIKQRYVPLSANGVFSIIYDAVGLLWSRRADAVLLLGVSGAWCLPIFRAISSAKVVVNIDGKEWARKKWSRFARIVLRILERFAVRYSRVVVSDNAAIRDYVRNEYDRESVLIAYGGDPVDELVLNSTDALTTIQLPEDYWFALSRIEPENNTEMILNSFLGNGPTLLYIGNWDQTAYGRKLKRRFANVPTVQMIDPIYDASALLFLRRRARCYVHGHSAGGTNPSLVEAMFAGTPVVAFRCDFNRNTTHDKAVYFSSSSELANIVQSIDMVSLQSNALSMRRVATQNYTWDSIANQYERVLFDVEV